MDYTGKTLIHTEVCKSQRPLFQSLEMESGLRLHSKDFHFVRETLLDGCKVGVICSGYPSRHLPFISITPGMKLLLYRPRLDSKCKE